ncbi:MAG: hypothetical protein ACKOHK_06425 [Planctomycetia bacterium]
MRAAWFRTMAAVGIAVAVTVGAGAARAEVTSGQQVGESVGAMTVTKVTGNALDGVPDGKTLCYRCKMGSRPVVMVFARTADDKLAKLLKKLDEEIEEHASAKLTGFVNMLGGDAESLKKDAAEFVKLHGIERIAFVVPEESANGPADYKIAPDADLTIVCFKGDKVQANHAMAKGQLSDEKIDAIVEAACAMTE